MHPDINRTFIKRTESLVNPRDVTAISFLGDFNKILPKSIQRKIMKGGSAKVPYMGFIVDPYCLFLAYRINDPARAQAMLPEGFDLAEASVFKDQKPCPLMIVGAFSVRTSAFVGNRLEFYVIARQRATGRIAWIIADYETNTSSYDPRNAFCGYSSDPATLTTTPYGELIVDFAGKGPARAFSLSADLPRGSLRELEPELWIQGNLLIDYGGEFKTASPKSFSLIFDPFLMKQAIELPLTSLQHVKNTFFQGLINAESLVCAAVFPYSQHFVIKQDLEKDAITNETELNARAMEFLEDRNIRRMSGDDIKKPLIRGLVASALLTYGVITALVIKVLWG